MKIGSFSGGNNSLAGGLSGQSAVYSPVTGLVYNPSTFRLQTGITTTGAFDGGVSETSPMSLFWNAAGSKVFFSGTASGQIKSYDVTNAFNLQTINNANSRSSVLLKAIDGITNVLPTALAFSANGLNLFSISQTQNKLFKHTLGTAFLLSSIVATAAQENALNFATATSPNGMSFVETGGACKFMFANAGLNPAIQVYSMAATFDLTTCAQLSTVVAPIGTAFGCCWMDAGNKMALLNFASGNVRCYETGTAFTVPALTSSSHYNSVDLTQFGFAASSFTDIQFNLTGTNMFLTDQVTDRIVQFGI